MEIYDLLTLNDDMIKIIDKQFKTWHDTLLENFPIIYDTDYIGCEIKCPYCGNTYKFPFDLYNDNNLIECLSCHGEYQQSLNIIGICVDPIQK